MFIASVMLSSHLILWHSLLLLPSIFPSIRDFSNELSVRIRWPKYWCFSFSISPSNEYSGLISLKIDWFDLLAVQGTFRSLPQHHSLKASILWHSAFFMVQLSQLYVTTGNTIALTIQTFVGRVMSLLFNTLSRFVIAFLPRSNRLLISWLQSLSTVIFGAQEEKICHYFHIFPFYLPWSSGAGCDDLSFLIFSLKPALSLSSLTLIKRLFSSSLLSVIRVVSSAYLRLLMFLPPILILAYSSSPSGITALSWQRSLHNSMKLWAMPCRAAQDGQVRAESFDKVWSTGRGNGKPSQYTCHENLMNCGRGGSVAKSCLTLCDPMTVACQAPLPKGFSR